MNTYRLKSSKPYKIIKCKRGKNLTRINISSECRNSKSITNVAGHFLSAVYVPGNAENTSKSIVLYMQPSQRSSGKYLVPLSQVKETSWLLYSLNMDALNSLFDIIQEGLALWRVFMLRVVVHIS